MNYSIEIKDISKRYRSSRTKFELFKEWFIPFYKPVDGNSLWALRDIKFNVSKGESVGIVGMNGAGKSTLLKIITGTITPTTGSINIKGRVVALLELGMGFHPDFTGRQNIMFAGQLIGLSADEIHSKMSEISDFAEIGYFIDESVRTYSSGMQMRLAFALATAVRPEILIIDEALSVGDAYFQQKSFARIRKFKEEGTTLLFVSHDKTAILTLCDRAILLNNGQMVLDDTPSGVMDYYNSLIAKKDGETILFETTSDDRKKTVSGNHEVIFKDVFLENSKNQRTDVVRTCEKIKLVADIFSSIDVSDLVFGFLIKERTGIEIYGVNTFLMGDAMSINVNEMKRIYVEFDANIGPGIYSISVALHTGTTHNMNNYHWIDLAVTFSVINTDKTEFIGFTYLEPKFII